MSKKALLIFCLLALGAAARAQVAGPAAAAPAAAGRSVPVATPPAAPVAPAAPVPTAPAPAASPSAAADAPVGPASSAPAKDEETGEELAKMEPVSDIEFVNLKSPPQFAWGGDPFFRQPGFATIDPEEDLMTPEKLSLDGIIFDPEDPVAIINGRTVGIGDDVEGFIIEAVAANYVLIRGYGYRSELALPPATLSAHAALIEPTDDRQPSSQPSGKAEKPAAKPAEKSPDKKKETSR